MTFSSPRLVMLCHKLGFMGLKIGTDLDKSRDGQDPPNIQDCITTLWLELGISCGIILLSLLWLVTQALFKKSTRVNPPISYGGLESEQQPINHLSTDLQYGTLPSTNSTSVSTNTAHDDWAWLCKASLFRLAILFPLHLIAHRPIFSLLIQWLIWGYVVLLTKFDMTYIYHLRWMYLSQFAIRVYQLSISYPSPSAWLFLTMLIVETLLLFTSLLIPQSWDTTCNHEQNATILSILTFHYVQPMLNLGDDIVSDEIFPLHPNENPQHLHELKSSSLTDTNQISFKGILLRFKTELIYQILFSLVTLVFGLCVPVLLNRFLTLINQPSQTKHEYGSSLWDQPVVILIMLFMAGTTKSLSDSQALFLGRRIGIRVKSLILSLVTERTLKLPIPSSGEGTVTNLLSVDSHEIAEAWCYLHFFYTVPIQLVFCLGYLGILLGIIPMLAAVLVTALTLPVNYYVARTWERIQGELMELSDARMTVTQQLLGAWRTLRMFGWQPIYQEKIQKARKEELKTLKMRLACWVLGASLWFTFPLALILVTFLTYSKLLNNQLTPEIAFTCLLLFKTLKEPVDILPEITNLWLQARVALKRVNEFLDITLTTSTNFSTNKKQAENSIKLDSCTFSWNDQFKLKDVTLTIPEKQLTLIMGPTGSGKSSLLLGMLGEMPLVEGKLTVGNKIVPSRPIISYVAQTPWLEAGTIRDNILLGEPFQSIRYQQVLEACRLVPDLKLMPQADLTRLGSAGLTLSGGQRQRVALARAIYSSSRIILLDDCLSAVDPRTMNDLWRLFLGGGDLVKGRTIVLISHHYPPATFNWKGLLVNVDSDQVVTAKLVSSSTTTLNTISTNNGDSNKDGETDTSLDEGQKLIEEEEEEAMASGSVPQSVYWRYFNASGGRPYWIKLLSLLLIHQGLMVTSDYWLKLWSNSASTNDVNYYLTVYLILGVMSVLLITYRVSHQFLGSLSASVSIHDNMLLGIINAPHNFLESTPIGRITNRFSKDLQCIDQELISTLGIMIMECLAAMSTLVLIFVSLPYPLLTLAMLSGVVYVGYTLVLLPYIRSSRQLKRIESVTRSPIYTHATNLSSGCITLRAYQRQAPSMLTTYNLIEQNLQAFIMLWSTNRWLQIRSDALGNLIALVTGLLLLVAIEYKMVDASTGGLILSYALNLASHILWITRFYAMVEMNMNSMERVMEYDDLLIESNIKNAGAYNVDQDWPKDGAIDLDSLTVQHNPNKPPALFDLSVTINSGDKVGVVGRTGAGKSTLAQTLLALTPAPSSGKIAINQINLHQPEINLKMLHHQLRTNITMIPQDPTELINCRLKLRDWLDPEARWPDFQLINALKLVGLPLPEAGLDEVITRVSYSMGQLQLIALARAVIRKSKIVIMDEATASVDHATDDRLQKLLLGGELLDKQCTLICIAHRLNTVMGYDKILVLDKGQIVEWDTPENLLKLDGGHFKKMVQEMGH